MMNIFQKSKGTDIGKRRKIFWFFSCSIIIFSMYYVFAVQAMAVNRVRIKQAEEKERSIVSQIGALEAVYLSHKKDITLSLAYANGFEDAKNITFLQAKKSGLVSRR